MECSNFTVYFKNILYFLNLFIKYLNPLTTGQDVSAEAAVYQISL